MNMMAQKLRSFKITKQSVLAFCQRNAILLVLFALILAIAIANPRFISARNLTNIAIIAAARAVIAMGAGGILIAKGVDLSAGRTVGLAACIAASLMQRPDYVNRMFTDLPQLPVIVAVLAAIAVGALIGLCNGTVVSFLKVPPFIATLGSMVAVYGIASIYVDRPPLGAQPIGGLRADFTQLGTGSLGQAGKGIPYLVLIALAVTLIIWLLLNKTAFGKNIYAIGGNADAALISGVNVAKNTVAVYALAGALYGLAGAMLAARTGGATNNYGMSYELDAIAACVIGGVSTNGGIGTVGGMLTGVLIFEVLNNGLVVLGISAYWQQIIKGFIIVAAVSVDIRKYIAKR